MNKPVSINEYLEYDNPEIDKLFIKRSRKLRNEYDKKAEELYLEYRDKFADLYASVKKEFYEKNNPNVKVVVR